MLLTVLVQVVILSLVGGVMLRLACWIFNKMSAAGASANVDEGDVENRQIENVTPQNTGEQNPFAAPASYGPSPLAGEQGVPTPTFLKAVAIIFATTLTTFAAAFCLLGLLSQLENSTFGVAIVNFGSAFIPFCLLGLIIKYALPTTFGKSAIVTIILAAIGLVFSLLVFGPIMLIFA